jgi:hypothetical protein
MLGMKRETTWASILERIVRVNKKFWKELLTYFPRYDADHIENDASNNCSIVGCEFVTAVTFLPSRCLSNAGGFLPSRCLPTIRGFLPSRCLATIGGYTDTQTQAHAHRQQRDLRSLFYFFQNKESRLKRHQLKS